MSEDNYSEDFEPDQVAEEEHQLRLSFELHSVKDLPESAFLYVKFNYPLLGNGRTQAANIRKNTECRVENAFQAHEFSMTKSQLLPTLSSSPFILEVWHADKFTKDKQLGTLQIKMEELLRAPLKKTAESVLRVLDSWVSIENDSGKYGQIRILLYLEDLGLKKSGAALAQASHPTDYQTAFELEVWKKSEEAKWKATLKEKEQQHIALAAVEWQERENQRERQFQKITTELTQLENKVRAKALELQKREQKIISLEDELRQKINDTGRQLAIKEEEIQSLKNRVNDSRNAVSKENKILQGKLDQVREELKKTEEELYKVRREQDTKTVQNLRTELNNKTLENSELKRQIDQMAIMKESYREQFEKIKSELVRALRSHEDEKKEWQKREMAEIQQLKLTLESKKYQEEESKELKQVKEELVTLQKTFKENQYPDNIKPLQKTDKIFENRINLPIPHNSEFYSAKEELTSGDELSRLKQEKAELIASGMYTEEDALIMELDRQIASLLNI